MKTDFSDVNPGVFWATLRKAVDHLGGWPDVKDWTVEEMLNGFPLTPDEHDRAVREHEAGTEELLAMRAARGGD